VAAAGAPPPAVLLRRESIAFRRSGLREFGRPGGMVVRMMVFTAAASLSDEKRPTQNQQSDQPDGAEDQQAFAHGRV
jgi:hypothetical protein